MATIANAYVQLLPSFEGIEARMTAGLAKPSKSAGTAAGKDVSGGIGNALSSAGSKLASSVGNLGKGIGSRLSGSITDEVRGGIDDVATDVWAKMDGAVGKVGDAFSKLGGGVRSALGDVGRFWGDALADVGSQIGASPIGQAFSGIAQKASGAFGAVRSIASTAFQGVAGTIKGVGTFAGEALSGIAGKVAPVVGVVGSAVGSVVGKVGSALGSVAGTIGSAFSATASKVTGLLGGIASKAGQVLGSIGGLAAKGAAAAGAALVSGVAMIGKSALDSYKDYEQLVGGMDTLFKGSSNQMQIYAHEAYKTAQMSANDYMQLSTDFAASMITSLGGDTAKAAEASNSAIIDMADNANKMGTSMEDVENAYRGFSKQNYTMLDNLKLGYGGTKEEMERLLADAGKLTGQKYDISNFADVTSAIHAMQVEMGVSGYSVGELSAKLKEGSLSEKEIAKVAEDMGISHEEAAQRMRDGSLTVQDAQALLGTSAREAATTIEGSLGMMSGAWQNWLTGLGRDDAHMDVLTADLVEGVQAAATNILPRVAEIVSSLASALPDLLDALGPAVQDALATIGEDVDLGSLAETVTGGIIDIGATVAGMLPGAFGAVVGAIPSIAEKIAAKLDESLTGGAAGSFVSWAEGIASQVGQAFSTLTSSIDMGAVGNLLGTVAGIAGTAISSLVGAFQAAAPVIANVANAVMPALATGFQIAASFISGVVGVVTSFGSSLLSSVGPAVETVSPYIQTLGEKAMELGGFITSTVLPVLGALGGVLGGVVGTAVNFVAEKFDALMQFLAPVGEFFGGIADGIGNAFGALADRLGVGVEEAASSVDAATETATAGASEMSDSLTSTWDGMIAGAEASYGNLAGTVTEGMDSAAIAMQTGASGIENAATEAADSAGTALSEGIGQKAGQGVDTAAMEAPATTMVQNAVTAAKAVDATSIGQQFSQQAASGVDVSAMASQLGGIGDAVGALEQTATVKVEADLTGVNQLRAAASSIQGAFRSMSSAVQAAMANASRSAASAAASIRASMNIPNKTVHINVAAGSVSLPHFYMNGRFDPKSGSVPSVGVNWYAKGAIFGANSPGLIGVGDAPVPEVVAPLDDLRDMLGLGGRGGGQPAINVTVNGVSGPDETARAIVRALRMSMV